jgi:hypothetical protein
MQTIRQTIDAILPAVPADYHDVVDDVVRALEAREEGVLAEQHDLRQQIVAAIAGLHPLANEYEHDSEGADILFGQVALGVTLLGLSGERGSEDRLLSAVFGAARAATEPAEDPRLTAFRAELAALQRRIEDYERELAGGAAGDNPS